VKPTADVRAYIASNSRGSSVIRIWVSDLYGMCDALDRMFERAVEMRAEKDAEIAQKDERIRHLEANLEAAQRRNARMGR
jgi:hypothetical protein